MSNARWEILQEKNPPKWVQSDFIKRGWEDLKLSVCLTEIRATKYRMKMEDEDFTFTFLEQLSEEMHEKLSDVRYYDHKKIELKQIFSEIRHVKRTITKTNRSSLNLEKQPSLFELINTKKMEDAKTSNKGVSVNDESMRSPRIEEVKVNWNVRNVLNEIKNGSKGAGAKTVGKQTY